MAPEEIWRLLKRIPFQPFALYMSDGTWHPVQDPHQVLLTRRTAYVGVPGKRDRLIAKSVVICDLDRVCRLGPLPGEAGEP